MSKINPTIVTEKNAATSFNRGSFSNSSPPEADPPGAENAQCLLPQYFKEVDNKNEIPFRIIEIPAKDVNNKTKASKTFKSTTVAKAPTNICLAAWKTNTIFFPIKYANQRQTSDANGNTHDNSHLQSPKSIPKPFKISKVTQFNIHPQTKAKMKSIAFIKQMAHSILYFSYVFI